MNNILVIDDKIDNLVTMQAIIKSFLPGYEVLTADNGAEGIKIATDKQPAVILLDVIMPRMNGYEVCEKLKSDPLTEHIPIIMVTAIKTDQASRIKGLELGADAFLSKPVDPPEMAAQVKVMLRLKDAENKLRSEKMDLEKVVLERTRELQESNASLREEIKERIETENQLRLQSTILGNVAEGIYLIGVDDLKIKYTNRRFEEMFGYEPGEMIGMAVANVNYAHAEQDPETVKSNIVEVLKKNGEWHGEVQNVKKDGTPFWCYANVSVFEHHELGNVIASLHTDITVAKQAIQEKELALAEAKKANQVKDLFMANMSHEIRTPLNSILGFSQILMGELNEELNSSQLEYFDIIDRSSKRLMNTVHGILDLSQIEAGTFDHNPQILSLSSIVESLNREFTRTAQEKGLKYNYINKVETSFVYSDETCLNRAISNLIDNAIKYTSSGEITISLLEKEGKYQLVISDTGEGISKEFMENMYDTYTQESTGYTKKYQGLGLGLAVVKRCLDLDDIAIEVDSTKNDGTTFILIFNIENIEKAGESKSDKVPLTDKSTLKSNNKQTILVVEDDPNSQLSMKVILSKNYEICFAVSVDEAKQQLLNNDVSLILLDLSLEGSEDGLDLMKYITSSEKWHDLPVIAVTAHAFITDRDNALNAGCRDYMSKPINISELREMVKKYI